MKFEFTDLKINPSNKRFGEPYKDKHKIYISIDNETIIDNLMERQNRPYEVYKEVVIPKLMELIDFKFPTRYASIMKEKWGWRQDTGCSTCRCSPGFVGDNKTNTPLDIFVTIKIN